MRTRRTRWGGAGVLVALLLGGPPSGARTADQKIFVAARSRVYVSHAGNAVSVLRANWSPVFEEPVGGGPSAVAVRPDGARAYVTNSLSNSVSVLDTATNTVVATVAVGAQPQGVAIRPDGARAYVTNPDADTASVLDITAEPPPVVDTVSLPGGCRDVPASGPPP